MVKVSVIVPQWNITPEVRDVCHECFLNVYSTCGEAPGWELISIDNASLLPVLVDEPNFSCERNDKNEGVAAAWNKGARKAKGEYLVFLNSDCFPHGDWLQALVSGMVGKVGLKPIGLLSPAPCEPEGLEALRETAGRLSASWSGACFMMRRDLWESVGGFDERFSFCFEDRDMKDRLEQLGYVAANTTDCCMTHLFHTSAKQSDDWETVKAKNKKLWENKNGRQ